MTFLLQIHSVLRWLVLLAGLVAVARLANGYSRNHPYGPADQRASRIFVGLFDLQFLIGLILYATSPIVRDAMKNMATAMQEPHTRFFVAEHPMMMFIALCVAHGSSIWARKSSSDRVKFLRSAIGFALALGLILAGIPWFRLGA
jgi:H+/gluconate symporter-like permease